MSTVWDSARLVTGEPSAPRVRRAPSRLGPALAVGALGVGLMMVAAAVSVTAPDQVRVPVGGAGGDGRDPAELFAHAAEVLTEAGTFRFDGTWVFTDVNDEPHPPPYFDPDPDDSELSGDVELPGKLRQVTDSAIGYDVETVISAQSGDPALWQRFTAYPGQLERRPWAEEEAVPICDLSQLPEWLTGVTDPVLQGTDPVGRRIVQGALAPQLVDEELGPSAAVEIALTVDDDGTPRSVDLEVRGPVRVSREHVRLLDIGAELSVDPPGEAERDPTPTVAEEDLALFAGPTPLGLAGAPADWSLQDARVAPYTNAGCTAAVVMYGPGENDFMRVFTTDGACAEGFPAPGEPMEVAGFHGTAGMDDNDIYAGTLISGDVGLSFRTTLGEEDARRVLETVVPFDPSAEPQPIDGTG
jgi:hypothetical protein